ncbi:Bug family tripartite tricarboxylate transporter substrate binding protein [Verticiella sediminum]|nr:tripartite tricarboxylate transporter substrate binding protein [Verticiella sediminum]
MPFTTTRRTALKVLAGAALTTLHVRPFAQTKYPARPVQFVVPFPAGGATDIIGRVVAQALSTELGQPFVVENKAGAAGMLGVGSVARAPADGYTLVLGNISTHAISPALQPSIPYDAATQFEPLGMTGRIANVLVVRPSLGVRSVAELIDHARTNPDKLSYGSSGAGGTPHMSAELFKLRTETRMAHIPYKGGGPMLTDLLGGHVDLAFGNMPEFLPHIREGSLVPLGVTSAQRSSDLPEVPTIAEAGVQDYEVTSWFGLFAPAGLPGAIRDQLAGAIAQSQRSEAVTRTFAERGVLVDPLVGADFADYVAAQRRFWADFIKQSGIQADA